jgi:hypothetical protein
MLGMDIQTRHWPTAEELVQEAIDGARIGDIISVKATIAMVRERGPYLYETDCQLVTLIVTVSTDLGLFVAFDLRE